MTPSMHPKQRAFMHFIHIMQKNVRIDDWHRTQQSTCYIVRTQRYSTSPMSPMTPSMHPKQLKIMQNIHLIGHILELMIGIAMNSRLATSFVLRMTRRRA